MLSLFLLPVRIRRPSGAQRPRGPSRKWSCGFGASAAPFVTGRVGLSPSSPSPVFLPDGIIIVRGKIVHLAAVGPRLGRYPTVQEPAGPRQFQVPQAGEADGRASQLPTGKPLGQGAGGPFLSEAQFLGCLCAQRSGKSARFSFRNPRRGHGWTQSGGVSEDRVFAAVRTNQPIEGKTCGGSDGLDGSVSRGAAGT